MPFHALLFTIDNCAASYKVYYGEHKGYVLSDNLLSFLIITQLAPVISAWTNISLSFKNFLTNISLL